MLTQISTGQMPRNQPLDCVFLLRRAKARRTFSGG